MVLNYNPPANTEIFTKYFTFEMDRCCSIEPPQDKKHKAGCKKINDTFKVDNLFFRIFLYFYNLFLNSQFAQLTPQIWENYHNIYPFVPIEIILDKKA